MTFFCIQNSFFCSSFLDNCLFFKSTRRFANFLNKKWIQTSHNAHNFYIASIYSRPFFPPFLSWVLKKISIIFLQLGINYNQNQLNVNRWCWWVFSWTCSVRFQPVDTRRMGRHKAKKIRAFFCPGLKLTTTTTRV